MATEYEKEIQKQEDIRDSLILSGIISIYADIRKKTLSHSKSVKDKAGSDRGYFNTGVTQRDFEESFNKDLRPDYLKRDTFSREAYTKEYPTAYQESRYAAENQGISKGFRFDLPGPKAKQLKESREYALSKLMNRPKMLASRNIDIAQLEDIIIAGVQRGQSLTNINKELDIAMGFRNSKGEWIKDPAERMGQNYQTRRILRTEINRARNDARHDQWLNQQELVPSRRMLVETLDNRTRQQSVRMDGQISNEKGEFRYPNGEWALLGRSGVAKWDINDRGTTIDHDPDYPPETRIARDPDTGVNSIVPYKNVQDWADDQGLKRNKYGQWISSKPEPKRRKTPKVPTISKPKTTPQNVRKKVGDITYDYGRVDPELADIWTNEINRQVKEYPEIDMAFVGSTQARNRAMKEFYRPAMEQMASKYHKPGTKAHDDLTKRFLKAKVGRTGKNVMGQSISAGEFRGITLNEKFSRDIKLYRSEIQSQIDSGWFVDVDPTKKTLMHELGHQMDSLVDARKNKKIIDIYRRENITSGLSGYGNTSVEEMIAESWAEYKLSANPRPIATEIGGIIDNEYSRRYKKTSG